MIGGGRRTQQGNRQNPDGQKPHRGHEKLPQLSAAARFFARQKIDQTY
jgi:hypothetical protein